MSYSVVPRPPIHPGGDHGRGTAASGDGGGAADPLAVANRLRPVLLHLSRRHRRETDPRGVTGGQLSLLAAIHDHPGIGVSELAAREGMSPPTMCAHIDRLEAAGLVARARAEGPDRRRVGLTLTVEGSRQLAELLCRPTAWLAEGLRSLSPDQLRRVAEAVEPLRLLAHAPAVRDPVRRERPGVPSGPRLSGIPVRAAAPSEERAPREQGSRSPSGAPPGAAAVGPGEEPP